MFETEPQRLSNRIARNLSFRIAIAGIESSREVCYDSEIWVLVCNFDDSLGLHILMKR